MKSLHIQTAKSPGIIAKTLFKLERLGKYKEALAEVRDIWEDISASPKIEEFELRDAAEILLRCGSLIGFHGHIAQIPLAQQKSKDLLTEAHTRFLEIGNVEKLAECENYLALAYWRTGEINEGQAWIEEALSHSLANSNNVRLYSHVIKCLINHSDNRYQENLISLMPLEAEFLNSGDNCLIGDFYNHCGLAEKNLDHLTEALQYLELARYYHEKSRHKIYLGTVENNLAQLYKAERRFGRAHSSIDRALQIYKQLKDKTREGSSYDTKALIYLAEEKYDAALQMVDISIKLLRKSENSAYLAESLLTRSKILLYHDDFTSAVFALIEAADIVNKNVGESAAKQLIQQFESTLKEKNDFSPSAPIGQNSPLTDAALQLVLPPSIAHYDDYQGVRITNSHLEDIGLKPGSLAIVVDEKVKRGDLVAICEIEDDSISCGFYDSEFGIVCLEGVNSEPILFDDKKVSILGKIVGFCNSEADADGNLIVETINA